MALPHKTKIPVGTVLAGKYKITREIGRGGMAAVYEAENVDIGKRVAIKVLAQELTSSAIVVERFLREARAAASIRSPYICDVYDSGRLEDGPPFLVLELLEGESLYERMTKVRYLDVETTVDVLTQVCRGLTKAHASNIVHRDLKPENIFLTKDEEGKLLAKILDFGLAKFYAPLEGQDAKAARLTREGAVFGTPAYMSPEQVRGQGAVDLRADLWALGCIAYECVTGKTVWATDQGVAMTFAQIANAPLPNPQALRADLPDTFTEWFGRALDRNIEKRFQTAKEFAAGLAQSFRREQPSFSAMHALPELLSKKKADDEAESRRLAAEAPTAPPPPMSERVPDPASGQATTEQPHSARASKLGFVAAPDPHGAATEPSLKPKSSALGRAVVIAGAAALAGGAVYAGYLQLGPDNGSTLPSNSASPSASIATSSSNNTRVGTPPAPSAFVPSVPWLTQVREAQNALAADDPKGASKLLKEAFDKGGGHGVPRTMLEHVAVATLDAKQSCRLAGLGRPRTFDLATAGKPAPASRPSIVLGPKGPVMVWTDAHEGAEHVYTALLDPAMRNVSDPIDVSPEAASAGRPDLQRVGDKLVLSYWDARGQEPGVKVRFLDGDGRIASPATSVGPTTPRPGAFWPALTRAPDNSFYVAWVEEGDGNSEDLFLRHLKPTLEPQEAAIRITDLVPAGPQKPRVRWPAIGIEGGALQMAFRLEKDPSRTIEHVRLPLTDATKGLETLKPGKPRVDRTLGESAFVGDKTKADTPSIACGKGACYIVWHGEGGLGASIAYLDPSKVAPLWYRKFTRTGGRPSVGISGAGNAQVVWYEQGRVLTAAVGRDQVEAPSRIARVSGDQPVPSIAAGEKPGEWYIAWLDYETGHLEAYGARLLCK
jgi:serine/threonine-protein kinase